MKENIKEIWLSPILTFLIGVIALLVSCKVIASNTAICYPIEMWLQGCSIVDFFLPLLASIPFSFVLLMKRKNGFLTYVSLRTNKKIYIAKQILTGMLLGGVAVFLMYYISLVVSVTLFPIESFNEREHIKDYLWGTYQANSPLLFGLFWCIWKGFVGSLFTGFGYLLGLFVDNLFVVSLAPFLYCMAENMITAILEIPEYSIVTSYVLNRLSPSSMKMIFYVVGVVGYLCITAIILFVLRIRRRRLYENVQND